MPIETFSAFVAEQAVGIVVGVTAVVVAPKVIPVLTRARQSEQWSDTKVIANRLNGIVVLPVGTASRTVYQQVKQLQPSFKHKGNKMKLCQFNFDLPVDPYLLIDLAKDAIVEHGGTVTGNLPEMMITVPTPLGEFDGICTLVADSTIHVAVTKKPELVSCDLIRNKLVEYLTQGVKMHVQATKAQGGQ